jgi:hypothetical protein
MAMWKKEGTINGFNVMLEQQEDETWAYECLNILPTNASRVMGTVRGFASKEYAFRAACEAVKVKVGKLVE